MAEFESREDGIGLIPSGTRPRPWRLSPRSGSKPSMPRAACAAPSLARMPSCSFGADAVRSLEGAALIAIAKTGLELTSSPRGLFATLFAKVDLNAARQSLTKLRAHERSVAECGLFRARSSDQVARPHPDAAEDACCETAADIYKLRFCAATWVGPVGKHLSAVWARFAWSLT